MADAQLKAAHDPASIHRTVKLKQLNRTVRMIIKADARREAFEDLRSKPEFAHCSRKALRAMAKKKVDGMLREQRAMEKADGSAAERDGKPSAE